MSNFPSRIVCLTEESVEFLFAIGQGHRVVGVSAYVKRPHEATKIEKVSAFINGHVQKIVDLKPDLILGFSDIQKDLARDLIGRGQNVFIANHRSIEEIFNYLSLLGAMVGEAKKTVEYLEVLQNKINVAKEFSQKLTLRPKVYIEEWDEPMICGIRWFSEIVQLCGAEDIFTNQSKSSLAKNRIVQPLDVAEANPDIILACWCGKKVKTDDIISREGWSDISAVKNKYVFELEPEIFLQPGPAPIISGIDILIDIFDKWSSRYELPR